MNGDKVLLTTFGKCVCLCTCRFCGPASSVFIPTVTAPRLRVRSQQKKKSKSRYTEARKVLRTAGEAVAETGLILSMLALYPDQVALLNDVTLDGNSSSGQYGVHICGPPGTGTTVKCACMYVK
jgi:hypothetical protein